MKRIRSIRISNSPFFDDGFIEFTDGLNCIMGGRGSGKSTLLFFIEAAVRADAEDNPLLHRVLRANLGSGTVDVEVETDEGIYRITKVISESPQPYTVPNNEFVPLSKIATDIACDIYEANRIEEIGRSRKDRLELIDRKAGVDISSLLSAIQTLRIDLDLNAQDIKANNRRLAQMTQNLTLYEQVEEDLAALRSETKGISDEDRNAFEEANGKADQRRKEKRYFLKTLESIDEFSYTLRRDKDAFVEAFRSASSDGSSDNEDLMQVAISLSSDLQRKIEETFGEIEKAVTKSRSEYAKLSSELSTRHDFQEAEFIKLKQRFDESREYVNRVSTLSRTLGEKQALTQEIFDVEKKRSALKETRCFLIEKLNSLKQQIYDARLRAVRELNEGFKGHIVITLRYGGISEPFEEKLRAALKGSNIKYNVLIPRIVDRFSCDEFARIIHLRDIASLNTIEGIDEARAQALLSALSESDDIYEIESLYCHDIAEFKLRIAEDSEIIEDNYRATDELSMGQRCTAVLPVIFAVSDNPLLVDQPEDNLDNKYITQRIHQIVRDQKSHRQMIFITHNPNIPVLSNAENNLFLLYEDRKSKVDARGTVEEVKDRIVTLLEGGKDAFNTRTEIYGDALD